MIKLNEGKYYLFICSCDFCVPGQDLEWSRHAVNLLDKVANYYDYLQSALSDCEMFLILALILYNNAVCTCVVSWLPSAWLRPCYFNRVLVFIMAISLLLSFYYFSIYLSALPSACYLTGCCMTQSTLLQQGWCYFLLGWGSSPHKSLNQQETQTQCLPLVFLLLFLLLTASLHSCFLFSFPPSLYLLSSLIRGRGKWRVDEQYGILRREWSCN